jgi:hypothetical protein
MKRNRVQICCIVTSANPTLPELMNFQLLLTTSNEAQGMRVQLREATSRWYLKHFGYGKEVQFTIPGDFRRRYLPTCEASPAPDLAASG